MSYGEKQAMRLYHCLEDKRANVTESQLLDELEISKSTLKRAITYLRQQNITVFTPRDGGYRIADKDKGRFDLSGELLNTEQLGLLLDSFKTLQQLVKADIHTAQLTPILKRMESVLDGADNTTKQIDVIDQQARSDQTQNFKHFLNAIEKEQVITATYNARSTNASTRNTSPQRLLRYRENWYLLAHCHKRNALRIFAIERFSEININLQEIFVQKSPAELTAEYSSTYGIFGGEQIDTAKIQFNCEMANWVKDEKWHKDQIITLKKDGSLILEIPIGSNLTELVRDLMRYAGDIKILQPKQLQKQFLQALKKGLANNGS